VSISGIVCHTEQGYENGTVSWFHNPASQVSSNYGIALDGTVDRIVDEGNTAWANGNFESNSRTISIEFEDNNDPNNVVHTSAQYLAASELIADIARRYHLVINRSTVKKHNEIPPYSHPECPGDLDVDHIVMLADGQLNQVINTVVPAPPATAMTSYHDLTTKVNITVDTLNVHTEPNSSSTGAVANTSDGMLHNGMIADIVGWATAQDPYSDNRNVWLKSFRGKWFWAGGTDFIAPAVVPTVMPVQVAVPVAIVPPVSIVAPVIVPVNTVTPPIAPVNPVHPNATYESFEIAAKVVSHVGSGVIDTLTGKALSKYPANRPLTVVGFIDKDGDKFLQTQNLHDTMPDAGLPADDFELYLEPVKPLDGVTPPITIPLVVPVKPTLEETLGQTNNWFVRWLLKLVHFTK